MKLGLFDHMQKHDRPALSYVELYKNHLEVVECADQASMDFYFVAEHHFDMGFSECPSPGSFLGAASQRTKRIRLGPLVYVLPLWNPIRVAEEWAVVDNLSNGRVAISFASGWQVNDFVLAPENYARRKQIMLEQIELVRKLWRGEAVSFRNSNNQDVPVRILPRPIQRQWRYRGC